MKKTILLLTILSVLSTIGCKKNTPADPEPEPTPSGDIIVAKNTRVIDQQTRKMITAIDTINYTLTVNGSSEMIAGLQVGDIMVDSASALAPNGYLRKVTAISNTKDGEVVINTGQATLTEAVNKGSINFNTGKISMGHVRSYQLAEGVRLQNLKNTDFTVFSFDYDKVFENENGKITISGHTDLDIEIFFNFDWDFDWLALPPMPIVEKFESGVEINQSASISCVSLAGAGIQERVSLAKFYFTPWTFMVGPVPVVFVPQIELFVEMDGAIVAVYSASASENFTGRLGTSYTDDNGWNEIAEKTYHSDFVAPNLDAGAQFTAHVGPEIALLLYGVAGPFANVTGCSHVSGLLHTGTQNWDLTFLVGAQASVGVKIDLIGFSENWSKDFCFFQDTLLHLVDEPFGNYIYIATPIEDQSFLVGDEVEITTSFTGETPDEVEFIIDYNTVFVDTEAPFEYTWNTAGFPEFGHIIYVGAKKEGVEIAHDNVSINLVNPVWEPIDLSAIGLNENTDANDLFFVNATKGWMTVNGPGVGKILTTQDAGISWNETYASSTGLLQVMMYNDQGEGVFLNALNKVMGTTDGGATLSELTYGQFSQPTFQWKNIFGLASNNDGEIVAVGKDTGIPYHFRIYRAEMAFHTPTGYFEVPYPNEYGTPPKIIMNGNSGFLYDIYNEDEPNTSYFMTTTDGGVSWQGGEFDVVTSNARLHDAHMPDHNHVWIVGEENNNAIVVMSDNGGQSWTKVDLTGTPPFSSVQFTSTDEGYATVGNWSNDFEAKVYRTTDGGHNWEPLIDTRSKYGLSSVFFLGQDFGVVSGKGPRMMRYSAGK